MKEPGLLLSGHAPRPPSELITLYPSLSFGSAASLGACAWLWCGQYGGDRGTWPRELVTDRPPQKECQHEKAKEPDQASKNLREERGLGEQLIHPFI